MGFSLLFLPILYSFNATHPQQPSLDRNYNAFLKAKCPAGPGANHTVALDIATPTRLDNKYYKELKYHRGLLTFDQTLMSSPLTTGIVVNNARHGAMWAKKFAKAMVHMDSLDVLTDSQGEVRRHCSVVN